LAEKAAAQPASRLSLWYHHRAKEDQALPKKRAKQQNRSLPLILMVVGFVLVVAAVVFSQNLPQAAPAPTAAAQNIPFSQVPRVSVADAKAAFDLSSAIFVDVRGEPYYTQGHIQGALSIIETDLDTGLAQLDPQAWIITYCT
jgi:hypothetical protein